MPRFSSSFVIAFFACFLATSIAFFFAFASAFSFSLAAAIARASANDVGMGVEGANHGGLWVGLVGGPVG